MGVCYCCHFFGGVKLPLENDIRLAIGCTFHNNIINNVVQGLQFNTSNLMFASWIRTYTNVKIQNEPPNYIQNWIFSIVDLDSKPNMLKFEKEGSKSNVKTKTCCYFQNLMFDNWVLFRVLFFIGSVHREETMHWCRIWALNFGSNLTCCECHLCNIMYAYDKCSCSIEVHASKWKKLDPTWKAFSLKFESTIKDIIINHYAMNFLLIMCKTTKLVIEHLSFKRA